MTQHAIRTRRITFDHPRGSLRRHYVDGDPIMSHMVALLSATFPPGEDFFVRSVRHYRDRIIDPVLAEQVRGFIGQEVVHGREHDRLNRVLREMGYPTHRIHALVKRDLALADRFLPPIVRLGFTAGLEHYTATIAEVLLSDPRAQRLLGDTQVRSVLLWHALEESEHRAVAFDVFRQVGGTEHTRVRTMRVISTGLLFLVVVGTLVSVLTDPTTYRRPGRALRGLAALRRSPFVTPEVVRRLRAYNRHGFHPDDFDNTELLDRWRQELFGPEGTLTAELK